MKRIQFSTFAGLALAAVLCPLDASANHRTGSLILPELIVAGDFNQDGKLDLAVNNSGFDNVAILLGDGSGGMTLNGHHATDTLPKGLQLGDVNRDGRLDVVTCNNWGYDETILLGDGAGSFHSANPPNEIDGDGEPVRCLLRDFNNDGFLDLAVNAPDDNAILFYFGDGKGNFPAPSEEVEDIPHPFGMAAGDFNRDGNLDMAISCPTRDLGASIVTILLGDGTGEFTASTFPVDDSPTSVQTTDLNRDGILDLVVAGALPENRNGNFIATYLGDGAGNFSSKQSLPMGPGTLKGEIAVGDFNEDGAPDVAFPLTQGTFSPVAGPNPKSTKVQIFLGDGNGSLVAGDTLTVGEEPHTATTADFNGDGHADLAVTNRTSGSVSVALGDGQGHFTISSTTSIINAAD